MKIYRDRRATPPGGKGQPAALRSAGHPAGASSPSDGYPDPPFGSLLPSRLLRPIPAISDTEFRTLSVSDLSRSCDAFERCGLRPDRRLVGRCADRSRPALRRFRAAGGPRPARRALQPGRARRRALAVRAARCVVRCGRGRIRAPVGPVSEVVQVLLYGEGGHFRMWHTDAGADSGDRRLSRCRSSCPIRPTMTGRAGGRTDLVDRAGRFRAAESISFPRARCTA